MALSPVEEAVEAVLADARERYQRFEASGSFNAGPSRPQVATRAVNHAILSVVSNNRRVEEKEMWETRKRQMDSDVGGMQSSPAQKRSRTHRERIPDRHNDDDYRSISDGDDEHNDDSVGLGSRNGDDRDHDGQTVESRSCVPVARRKRGRGAMGTQVLDALDSSKDPASVVGPVGSSVAAARQAAFEREFARIEAKQLRKQAKKEMKRARKKQRKQDRKGKKKKKKKKKEKKRKNDRESDSSSSSSSTSE